MSAGYPIAIELEYSPCPDGDNRLDIEIREGHTGVAYISSSRAKGGARRITIVFIECHAVRYFVTEDHESLCPGISDIESHFVEIEDSPWLCSLPKYLQTLKHYAFGLNHCLFECIAADYRVRPNPPDDEG